jgi:quercetin dioxygenase-like cupin family protein
MQLKLWRRNFARQLPRIELLVTAVVCLILAGLPFFARAQKVKTIANPRVQRREVYQASTTLLDQSGKPHTVHIAVRNWAILGNQHLEDFPEHGPLLVQLTGGKIKTTIDGRQATRHHGEFWVVPAHSKMTVDATGETATLQITNLGLP